MFLIYSYFMGTCIYLWILSSELIRFISLPTNLCYNIIIVGKCMHDNDNDNVMHGLFIYYIKVDNISYQQ